jgi:hypothetical protein
MLLRPACTSFVTVVRTGETLTGNTIIARITRANTSFTITGTSVGAFSPGMKVISIDNISNPSIITRTSTK